VGVAVGTLTWYGGFSTAVALTRRRVGDRLVRAVDTVSGLGLVAFGGVLAYRTVRE
jgi:putative LysE/RhtB family amino acid efflux pump